MNGKILIILSALGLAATGCHNTKKEEPVVSERYIHKYGYTLSKEEWDSHSYPGQVVTHLRNGATSTATYENGLLHGASTITFPGSQTVENYCLYNQGLRVKEIQYDCQGMPVSETLFLSPNRFTKTLWYANGSPLSIEEYSNDELLEGQYFSTSNETEARVEKGTGFRVVRDRNGLLLSQDEISAGLMTKRESFYPSGSPESTVHYQNAKLHGEKRTFTSTGEPLAIEEWINGSLHGKCTYFKNGAKDLEISYLYGKRHGVETHYIDGNTILQEIYWENDIKHGPSTYYIDGLAKTDWYYSGDIVSQRRFEEQNRLDEIISHIAPEAKIFR